MKPPLSIILESTNQIWSRPTCQYNIPVMKIKRKIPNIKERREFPYMPNASPTKRKMDDSNKVRLILISLVKGRFTITTISTT